MRKLLLSKMKLLSQEGNIILNTYLAQGQDYGWKGCLAINVQMKRFYLPFLKVSI